MLELYGITRSRTVRPLWPMHQPGLKYQPIPLDYRGRQLRDPGYLALDEYPQPGAWLKRCLARTARKLAQAA